MRRRRKYASYAARPSRGTACAGCEILHPSRLPAVASPMRAPATKAPLATSAESPAQSATTPSCRAKSRPDACKANSPPQSKTQPFRAWKSASPPNYNGAGRELRALSYNYIWPPKEHP